MNLKEDKLMYDERGTIKILKLVSGKGAPVKGLPLLKDTVGEQKIFLVFSREGSPLASNLKVPKDQYKKIYKAFQNSIKKSGCFTEALVLKADGADENILLRFDIDFQRRLNDVEIQAIELVLHFCFNSDGIWVWGRHVAGKTRLVVLQIPETWEEDKEKLETFTRLLDSAGYEVNRRHTLVYFDMWRNSKRGAGSNRCLSRYQ